MRALTTRRHLLATAATVLFTPFAPRTLHRDISNNAPTDVCFWRREQGPVCINGEIREY